VFPLAFDCRSANPATLIAVAVSVALTAVESNSDVGFTQRVAVGVPLAANVNRKTTKPLSPTASSREDVALDVPDPLETANLALPVDEFSWANSLPLKLVLLGFASLKCAK